MKAEYRGLATQPLWGELDHISQCTGSTDFQLRVPCGWWKDLQYNSGWAWAFFLSPPTVAHSFTFFVNNGVTEIATVTMAVAAQWASIAFALPSGGLQGLGDYIAVRHNTNALKSSESAIHTDEGNRIFVGLYPTTVL